MSKEWNISQKDLEGIASRSNFKYEETFSSITEGSKNAVERSLNTFKVMYLFQVIGKEEWITCVHGVCKIEWKLIERYKRGNRI